MARTKHEKIGMGRLYRDMGELSPEDLQTIFVQFKTSGFEAVCGG